MKTPGISLVFMCAMSCCALPAAGQITITSSDVSAQFAVGDTVARKFDTVTTSLNIGVHGPTSWDFTALEVDSALYLVSVLPSGTPYAAYFPGATHVMNVSLGFVNGQAILPATAYLYFQLAGDFFLKGEGVNIASGGATLYGRSAPADRYYGLPMTNGTTWTSTYIDTTDVYLGNLINDLFRLQRTVTRHGTAYVVDAYGPMTLPGGYVRDALRIKKTDTAAAVTVTYIFLAQDGSTLQVTASDPSQPDNGIITVQKGSINWNRQGTQLQLPIQLASFNASPDPGGAGVLLSWSTQSEVNNYGFDVQRSPLADAGFASVPGGFVSGHGTTLAPRQYAYVDRDVPAGTWYYRLKQIDLDGAITLSDPAKVVVPGGGGGADRPAEFSLAQNFPNPFNPETIIRYGVPFRTHVTLSVYNTLGERVALLVSGEQEAGFHDVKFGGSAYASGVYFYRLESAGVTMTKKFSLVR